MNSALQQTISRIIRFEKLQAYVTPEDRDEALAAAIATELREDGPDWLKQKYGRDGHDF